MGISIIQIILITIIAALKAYDFHCTQVVIFNSVFWGAISGLALGDLQTGLYIGGTMQLMSLGVVAVGGSSAPDYPLASIIATAIAISTGANIDIGLTAGIAVGMLFVQLDIVAKLINGVIARKAQDLCNEGKFNAMNRVIHLSVVLMMLTSAIPTFIAVALGSAVVNFVINTLPVWFTNGLTIASGILPAVGLSMLMTYMPTVKCFPYLIMGYVLSAYLGVPVLGIALVGVAFSILYYQGKFNEINSNVSCAMGGLEDE